MHYICIYAIFMLWLWNNIILNLCQISFMQCSRFDDLVGHGKRMVLIQSCGMVWKGRRKIPEKRTTLNSKLIITNKTDNSVRSSFFIYIQVCSLDWSYRRQIRLLPPLLARSLGDTLKNSWMLNGQDLINLIFSFFPLNVK